VSELGPDRTWNRPAVALAVGGAALVLTVMTLVTAWFGGTNLSGGASSTGTALREVPADELEGNGWRVLDANAIVAYYRLDRRVYLHGTVADRLGRIPPRLTVFTLPLGFRPRTRQWFVVSLNGASGTLVILPSGDVVALVPSRHAEALSLEGVSFYVE
jgi:hypothetical protein